MDGDVFAGRSCVLASESVCRRGLYGDSVGVEDRFVLALPVLAHIQLPEVHTD